MTTLPTGYYLSSSAAENASYIPTIYDALQTHPQVYWGRDRSFQVVSNQVERAWRAICVLKRKEAASVVAASDDGSEALDELVGFCRIVSDGEGFGYLCDVFVMPDHQKKGIAAVLIKEATENTGGEGVSASWLWFLWTKDAHGVYEKAGFKKPTHDWGMEKFPGGVSRPE